MPHKKIKHPLLGFQLAGMMLVWVYYLSVLFLIIVVARDRIRVPVRGTFSPVMDEIFSHAVWLYYRFCLSLRDVIDLLSERGIAV